MPSPQSSLLLLAVTVTAAAVLTPSCTAAFVAVSSSSVSPSTTTTLFSATGGWGIGQSRDLTDAEMSRGTGTAFDGYKLRERGDFLQQIKKERDNMKKDELDELLGVAQIAGISVKDPSERLNKFGKDVMMMEDEDDDLDVSVQWNDDESDGASSSSVMMSNDGGTEVADAESITRMDEDTGAPGVW